MVSTQCNGSTEEKNVPNICGDYSCSRVDGEDLYTGEWGDDANPEGQHVCDRCNSDRHRSLCIGFSHSPRDRIMGRSSPPGCQHDKSIIDSDT